MSIRITAKEAKLLAVNSGKIVNIDHILAKIHAAASEGRTEICVQAANPSEMVKLAYLGFSMKRVGREGRSSVVVSW